MWQDRLIFAYRDHIMRQFIQCFDIYSWSDVCELIKEKVSNFFATSIAFQYLDEDADYISVSLMI